MIKVLSLFDWIACWLVALKRIWIEVDKYYASEIDPYAKYIAKRNNPELIHIWNVKKVKWSEYNVDLLIWWSPCQWFSFAWKQLNFNDSRSKLFFEYVRILKECNPKYFLLENVVMKKEWIEIISNELFGIQPIEINSSLVSAQNRRRLYWIWMRNNNGWYNQISISLPRDKGLKMKHIMQQIVDKSYFLPREKIEKIKHWKSYQNPLRSILLPQSKSPTLTARGAWEDHSWMILIRDKWRIRKITPIECERLQTLPDNYTSGVDRSQRYKMLWNWWTVDVIAHIFKSILK